MKFSVATTIAFASLAYAEAPAPAVTQAPTEPKIVARAVSRTASINGFSDPLYDAVPECAQACLVRSTSNTPCPYWDAGCLCVMPQFAGPIGLCIAENCKGEEVVSATSLANSVCSSAGVPSPYWRIPSSVSDSLDYAATAIPSSEASSEAEATSSAAADESSPVVESSSVKESSAVVEESSTVKESSPVVESSSEQPQETESSAAPESSITDAPESQSSSSATTTAVIRTASINGFADPLYDAVPECAQACLVRSTSNTPCPYWDAGCLCVMPQFAGPIGLCIAENCKGEEVVSATSLANSVCSSAGVPSPYWRIPSSVSDSLDYAATAIPTSDASSEAIATSSAVAEESSAVEESSTVAEASSEQPQETGSSIVPESSVTDAPETSTTNGDLGFTQYPSVAKTASYNGFADPIYDSVPDCAKDCLKQSTSNTPCPYWDTGCLCVMPQFGGPIGKCIAEQCQGEEVVSATSLASSMCSSAGVWEPYWMIPSSVKDSLDYAATAVPTSEASSEAVATSSVEEVSSVEQPQETESASSAEPSSTVEETSDVASSASDVPSETPSLVTCYINNEAVAEVDYETGICDFELPSDLDPFFNFVSAEDYNIQYYYARVNGNQFTNDIRSAGRVISIPAKTLYKLVTRVHEVLLQQSAGAQKRDEVDDFLDSVADTDGTDTGIDLSVDVTVSSSSSEADTATSSLSESSAGESGAVSSASASASASAEESVASSASAEESVASSASATTFGSDSVSDVASSELPGTITVTETCTDDEGHVTTETVIITSHVTEYCEQTSASAVQSSACDEQSSAKSEQSSASEEQDKVVTTIYSCESAKSSLESVKSSAESAHKTEIVASCESELSSINSVESVAYVTLTSLIEVQESCIAKQTSLAQVQSSAASVQLSAAHAQESSRAVENAESAVAEASKAADEIQTVVEYITLTVENGASEKPTGVVASTITSVSLQTESTDEQSSSTSPAVEIANAGASLTASAFALIVSTGIFFGLLI